MVAVQKPAETQQNSSANRPSTPASMRSAPPCGSRSAIAIVAAAEGPTTSASKAVRRPARVRTNSGVSRPCCAASTGAASARRPANGLSEPQGRAASGVRARGGTVIAAAAWRASRSRVTRADSMPSVAPRRGAPRRDSWPSAARCVSSPSAARRAGGCNRSFAAQRAAGGTTGTWIGCAPASWRCDAPVACRAVAAAPVCKASSGEVGRDCGAKPSPMPSAWSITRGEANSSMSHSRRSCRRAGIRAVRPAGWDRCAECAGSCARRR